MMYTLYSRTHDKNELIAIAMNLSKVGVRKVYGGSHISIDISFEGKENVLDALSAQGVTAYPEGD